jgi:phosphomannomutase
MDIQKKINKWLSPPFDKSTIEQTSLMLDNDKEIEDSFYKDLEFGTGGMRGIMGPGTNRINKYTLGKSTQGLSNFLITKFKSKISVVIAYDCRNNSRELAQIVADVFSANNIKVYLFSDLRPTPELSFAVKYFNCKCGIVLTASHNPPEYNGYKVYWEDGGQIVPPEDSKIIKEINRIDYSDINFESNKSLIQIIDKKVDESFILESLQVGQLSSDNTIKKNITIVFTSIHGTSITLIPKVLNKAGFNNLHIVKEQEVPDGNFPTVFSPNPEEKEALNLALTLGDKTNADIVIGTDPDGDRLGIAVRDNNNKLVLLNGNEVMAVLIDILCSKWKDENKLNGNQFVGSTIVSTPLIDKIAMNYGVDCKLGLTGFKWIAKMIRDYPKLNFIGGGEESFGFMVGDFVRDKDAITSTLLACESAAILKYNKSSIYKKLIEIHLEHGLYREKLISLTKKGINGSKEISKMMNDFRCTPPITIDEEKIISIEDYSTSISTNLMHKTKKDINLPKSNVLIYVTEKGSKVALRPSGTEPKIKFYISVNTSLGNIDYYDKTKQNLDDKIGRIIKELNII